MYQDGSFFLGTGEYRFPSVFIGYRDVEYLRELIELESR